MDRTNIMPLSPNDRNLLLSSGYQESKNSRNSHRSARRREPQAGAGQANGPAHLRFGWAISDNRQLGQPEVGFHAGLDTGSSRGDGNGFYISRLSLDLPRGGEFIEP